MSILLGTHPRRTLVRVAVLVIASVVVFGWILIPLRASGISMQPTYEPGSFHLVNRLAFARSGPARGDVIAIRLAGTHVMLVKRVVGLPGERVRIAGGQVIVDDVPLDEPYVKRRSSSWELPETALGPDEYFVVGDNRSMAIGLHELGKARRYRVVGKIVY